MEGVTWWRRRAGGSNSWAVRSAPPPRQGFVGVARVGARTNPAAPLFRKALGAEQFPCQTSQMAVHHPGTIVPTKLELLKAWVPHQPWVAGADTSTLNQLGSYLFDDPDGESGIETHLRGTAYGQVLQVPLTYRGAPRESADHSLITTMTHTVLGDRWIYDACHDPVYVRALVTAILTGGREADFLAATETGLIQETVTTHVHGSGPRRRRPARCLLCRRPWSLRTRARPRSESASRSPSSARRRSARQPDQRSPEPGPDKGNHCSWRGSTACR